jgi:hypothetical protein
MIQSAASKAGSFFSAPPPAACAPGAQAAMASADASAISRAGSDISPMMRLACKSATPMMQALSAQSKSLSAAECDDSGDEEHAAEAMQHVSHMILCRRCLVVCSKFNNACSQLEQFVQQQQVLVLVRRCLRCCSPRQPHAFMLTVASACL